MADHAREHRLRELFDRALALGAAARERLIAEVGDELLAERLRALLRQDQLGTASVLESPAAAIEELRRLGNYELLRELGQGGMGTVWLARQVEPVERLVALKTIRVDGESAAVVERFEQERQTLALMNHPGIAQIYDGGRAADGTLYFAMEYVPGEPITAYCDRRRFDCRTRLQLFADVCDAVQYAHQKAVLHRDLKPGNVLVTEAGGAPRPKVIDFGVARALARAPGQRLLPAEGDAIVGTWHYMSPEQADAGGQGVDTRSDIYSLGVLLYVLLTGELPLPGGGDTARAGGDRSSGDPAAAAFAQFRAVLLDQPPPMASVRFADLPVEQQALRAAHRGTTSTALARHLRGDLDAILARALARDRNDRYASASELRADLGRHLRREPVAAMPPTIRYRVDRFVRRNLALVAAGALVLLGLTGGIVGTTIGMFGARHAQLAEAAAHALDRRQLARSAAQAEFLELVLFYGDPGTGERAPSLREVLDSLTSLIESRYGGRRLEEAAVRASLGRAYLSAGEPKKARVQLARAWDLVRGNPEQDPAQVLLLLNDLTRAERRLGNRDRVTEYQGLLLGLGTRELARGAPALAESFTALAELAQRSVAPPALLQRLDVLIETVRRMPAGDDTARLARALLGVIGLMLAEDNAEVGAAVLVRLGDAVRLAYGEDLEVMFPIARLADSLLRLGAFGDAQRYAADVLAMLDRLAFGDHWLRLQAERVNGLALVLGGEAAAGETVLLHLQQRLQSLPPAANEQARAAAQSLRELCDRLGTAGRLDEFCRGSLARWRAAGEGGADAGPWWLAASDGLPAAALQAALQALEALPAERSPAEHAAVGGVLLRLDRAGAALPELTAARTGSAPPSPELMADLVRALQRTGDAVEAGKTFAELEALGAATGAAPRVRLALARARAALGR